MRTSRTEGSVEQTSEESQEANMGTALTVAGLAVATLASFSIALLLDWLCLRGLMRLMPARTARPIRQAASGAGARNLFRMANLGLKG